MGHRAASRPFLSPATALPGAASSPPVCRPYASLAIALPRTASRPYPLPTTVLPYAASHLYLLPDTVLPRTRTRCLRPRCLTPIPVAGDSAASLLHPYCDGHWRSLGRSNLGKTRHWHAMCYTSMAPITDDRSEDLIGQDTSDWPAKFSGAPARSCARGDRSFQERLSKAESEATEVFRSA